MGGKYPYPHTWTDEHGIQRQAMIHMSDSGSELVWNARHPGDTHPWVNLDYNGDVRHTDDEVDDNYDPDEDRDGF